MMDSAARNSTVFRVTGLGTTQPDDVLDAVLKATINGKLLKEERPRIKIITAIVPSCYDEERKRVALVEFRGGVPMFLSELEVNPLGDWQVAMEDADIKFDRHFFGFTQLYAPEPDVPIAADIIAVTGLDGHAYGSWRGRGNLGRMWLRDFLKADLPHCRTMIYGYNSKLSSHGIGTIMDYGLELMEEIKNIRIGKDLRQRPLFFIAHSFGGIILAHCLTKAFQTSEDENPVIASLHRATYGILLFATPNKGLLTNDIQKMLAGQEKHSENTLLQQISHQSDLLISQLVDFKTLIRDRKIVSFYETEQTRQLELDGGDRNWKRTGDFITVVDTDSTLLLELPDHIEIKIPLHADHSMIVKFDNKHALGYRSALDRLIQFEKDAPRVVASRFPQAQNRPNPSSTVPFHKDSMFISREDIITNTRKSQEHVASQNHSRVALVGLGSDGNVVTDSDSDVSSEDFYLEDNLLAASSLSSVSAMPQIKIEDFITGISQLFRKDDGIRGTIWKALERSTDELKFDRPKIVRNFSRLLRRYAEELNQNSSTSVEKLVARFVRKKSHSITIALFHTMQPTETLQNRTAIVADQPVEKLMLDRFLDAQAQDANEIKIAETGSQNRNLMRQGKGEEDNASSDESEASYMNLNELQIDYSIEKVEAFMISGIPFANLKQRFQDFVGRSTLNDMPEVDAVRNPEQRDVSSNLIYGEDGMVQIRWQCKCGHQFSETMVEHKPGIAEEFVRHMHWDAPPDKQGLPYQWPWLHAISGFLRMFLRQDGPGARWHEDWWRGALRVFNLYTPPEVQRHPSTVYGDNVTAANSAPEGISHFVCICVRQTSHSKYLHHVEVSVNTPRIMDEPDPTDRDMFRAIQRRYHCVRPWWKRLLFCARLSSVQYYEFRLFYNPEDEVTIEEDWKDRFPKDHPEGEWHYMPSTRDRTPYLLDRPLFHYVRNPDHAPPGRRFWTRIPKKVREKLSCQNDPERPGWGLVMKEEWHQTAFLICWVPIIVIGAVGSGLYCFYARNSAEMGFTIFAGIIALIVWFYQLAQGYAKQGGLL